VAGEWAAALALMLVLAWEPWRRLRRLGLETASPGAAGRVTSPGFVFVLPLLLAAAPVAVAVILHLGLTDEGRELHLLAPGVAFALGAAVAVQALLCRRAMRRPRP
jgi:hypothetical protein